MSWDGKQISCRESRKQPPCSLRKLAEDAKSPMSPIPPSFTGPDDERLRLVEERLTFQQKLIDDLNAAILAQQGDLGRLRRELHECRTALERLAAAGSEGDDLPYEKPPHY